MKTPETKNKLGRHVAESIVRVLQRPRFKFQVTLFSVGPWLDSWEIKYDGYTYKLAVHYGTKTTSVTVTSLDEPLPEKGPMFYNKSMKNKELPCLRIIGVTIANKIKMRMFHDITSQ